MDTKRVGAAILKAVWDRVEPAFHAIERRMEAITARLDNLPRFDLDVVEAMVRTQVTAAMAGIQSKGGEPITVEQIQTMMESMVAARISLLPVPRDGRDADEAAILQRLMVELAARIDAIPAPQHGKDGIDGRDADPEAVKALVASSVASAVAAIPVPREVPIAEIDERIRAAVTASVAELPKPQDGKDGESVHIDTVKLLVNEAVRAAVNDLPKPVNGKDGKDIEPELVRLMVAEAVAALPKPNDGRDGRDVDLNLLSAMIDARVTLGVASIPKPQDGRNADLSDVVQLIETAKAQWISEVRELVPPPGVDLIDEMIAALEDDSGPQEGAEDPPNIQVHIGRDGTPTEVLPTSELEGLLDKLVSTMMMPTKPIYRDGKVIGAQRVRPEDLESGGSA